MELDLLNLWLGVRRQGRWILGIAALLGALTFLVTRLQAPAYEATTSLVSSASVNYGAPGSPSSGGIRDTLAVASPVPDGALQEALQGPVVMGAIIRSVQGSQQLSPALRHSLAEKLQLELQRQKLRTVTLDPQIGYGGNSIYTVRVRAATAQAAALVSGVAAQALLDWDRNRARSSLQRAQQSLKEQNASVERQLGQAGLSDLDRQTLYSTRALLQQKLAQAAIQAEGVSGSLELVAPAVAPLEPVAPKPVRNSLLVVVLVVLAGTALAALRSAITRTVNGENDLTRFGIPILGVLPRLGDPGAVASPGLALPLTDAIGYLSVNLRTLTGGGTASLIMIASPTAREDSRTLTRRLAVQLARGGERVLVVDADLSSARPVQRRSGEADGLTSGLAAGRSGAGTVQDALSSPEPIQSLQLDDGVFVLPAGPVRADSLHLLSRVDLARRLSEWGADFDLVLVEGPPLLAVADGLVLARAVDHTVLLVDAGTTGLASVRHALRLLGNAGVPLTGFVLSSVSGPKRNVWSRRPARQLPDGALG